MQMHSPLFVSALVLTGLGASAAAQTVCGEYLYSADYSSASIRAIDKVTGLTINTWGMVDSQYSITSFHGLAVSPISGVMYVVVNYDVSAPLGGRYLATVDLANQTTNPVGHLGDAVTNAGSWLSDICFDPTGSMWGLCGDGGVTPQALYLVDPSSATGTLLMQFPPVLGNQQGEAMAFDAAAGQLYRFSGRPNAASVPQFSVVDIASQTSTLIPLSGYALDEVVSLVNLGDGNFLFGDLNWGYGLVNTNGEVRSLGFVDHYTMGLALGVPEPTGLPFAHEYGYGCGATAGGRSGWLTHSGCSSPGNSIDIRHYNGEPLALSILAVGTGSTAAPLAPAPCDIQIFPLFTSFVLFADSFGDFSTTINVPSGIGVPFNFFFQAGQIHTNGMISMSNAMQVHFQ